ncbi:major facilitator superfamily domain-containing protein [Russula brevipes]|nr:major facilitator superfamily domain-containing protein [Russula brevipes]
MNSSSKRSLSLASHKLGQTPLPDGRHGVPKDWKFWCIIFSLALSVLLTAVEFTAIGAALPTIIRDLQGQQFIWVGSAYALGSTALVPLCGGLTQIIGRRPIMLVNMLIAGRAVQGLGAGAITSSVQIMLSDLVTLRERGTFSGLMALCVFLSLYPEPLSHIVYCSSWAVGGGVGPVIGGSLAENGRWRWLFYLNLPICAFNATLVMLFLRLKTPPATLREKLSKMDIIGNVLVIGSTTSVVIALTWGGVLYPWSSAHVLSPLVVGLVGLCVFSIYEIYLCKPPVVSPFSTMRRSLSAVFNKISLKVPIVLRMNWTGASGYLQNFVMAVVLSTLSYWYAVFFEACKDKSPSGAASSPSWRRRSQKTGKYVAPTYVGWVLTIVGAGLLTTLSANSSLAKSVGFQLIIGAGSRIPLLQWLFMSSRAIWLHLGRYAGGAILQNELKRKLPTAFLARFPQGVEIAFATIPAIPALRQPFKDQVRDTFADALKVVWQVVLGIAVAGFLCSLGMRQLTLHTEIDEDWGRLDLPADGRPPLSESESMDQSISKTEALGK